MSKSQAWGIFHTLVEMFTYRVHHMQPQYRIQLLTLLHSCAVPQTNQVTTRDPFAMATKE